MKEKRRWTPQEVNRLRAFDLEIQAGLIGQADIAKALGRSISSVEGKLRWLRDESNLGPRPERFEAPAVVASCDPKHLRLIADASPRGFGWWPDSVMARVYQLEASAPEGKLFWKAA